MLQAEGPDAFSQFHLYVCSAFLVRWSEKLREMDFQVRSSSHRAKSHPVSHAASLFPTSPGHHYVPAVVADARLDGRRNRDPPQRGVPAQFDLAQRAEPLHWKVNRVSCISALKPFPTFCLSLGRKVAQTHNTHNSRASAIKRK